MKDAIFGLSYAGSTVAGCIASQGHTIICVEVDGAKVAALNEGQAKPADKLVDTSSIA